MRQKELASNCAAKLYQVTPFLEYLVIEYTNLLALIYREVARYLSNILAW